MISPPDYIRDTIVAAATPPGTGGIAVVRISGPAAPDIGTRVAGKLPQPRQATLANFRDSNGKTLDQGIIIYFPGPNSFTGESVIELQGHGGPFVVKAIVDSAVTMGARHASPGEFSKRAFLNGKLDLVQAEAIADLISSSTQQATSAALRSLSGAFSAAVNAVQAELTGLRLHTEATLDFPEEDIDFLSDRVLANRIKRCKQAFESLLKSAAVGRLLRDGFQMVIIGRPNAGKSSLLNALSGLEAAIVTEFAGTTRDIVREQINLDGLAVELVDTAGLRSDPGRIEAEGIRRARDAIGKADGILWIQDTSVVSHETIKELEPTIDSNKPVIIVANKADLSGATAGLTSNSPPTVTLSAKTGEGIDTLREQIRLLAGFRDLGEGAFTARRRHLHAIKAAKKHLETGVVALEKNAAAEIFAEELRLAQQALGEVTGSVTSDELLGRIFSEFCIGK